MIIYNCATCHNKDNTIKICKNMSKLKFGITSAIAVGFVSVSYLILKYYKSKIRKAADVLKYLEIKIVTTQDECDKVIAELRRRSSVHQAVGFDCEWVTENGQRQPVALVQLSTFDGYCGLFRLNLIQEAPKSLKDLLEDENVYKVGVAPVDDAKYLLQDYLIHISSTLDVRHIVELCGHSTGGLAILAKSLLGIILDKSWKIRCSNWAAEELSERQVHYAAADAHVAIKMFVNLINSYHSNTLHWLWKRNDKNHWKSLHDICLQYADICFKTKNIKKVDKEIKKIKEPIAKKRYPHSTRAKPLYHNCFLEAPDGELLCTCDTKKAHWYVDNKLATMVKEEPLTVRLLFEPAGRSVGEVGRYYQLIKENKCVVCGAKDSYIRKNVVPREYRKFFPDVMKDHSSHDVVLLCGACHQRSNILDQRVRGRLAQQCAAPVAQNKERYEEDPNSKKLRSAARALLKESEKHPLPDHRRKELEEIILGHYLQDDNITDEILQEAANINTKYEKTDYESHGSKVVNYYMEHESLLRLEELWREHFLQSMSPKYMPELWSVKHSEERLRVRLNEGRLTDKDVMLTGL